MRRLRSAVDSCRARARVFLAGFGIVSALADDSDDPAPSAGRAPSTSTAAGSEIATTVGETASTATPTGDAATTGRRGGGGEGGDGAPPAPPPGRFAVDYGSWEGMFELANPEIIPGLDQATAAGELSDRGRWTARSASSG